MRTRSYSYSVEIDSSNENSWNEILGILGDANIYQTWAWGTVTSGMRGISHIVLKRDAQIVAAAQTRIIRIPLSHAGVAYVRWGPLWRRRDVEHSPEDLYQIARAMRQEYVDRRGLYLKIIPQELEDSQGTIRDTYLKAGFRWRKNEERTLYVSLREPIETIRHNMSKNWRKNLNKAEKMGLVVRQGTDDELFDKVEELDREMRTRKTGVPIFPIGAYRSLQRLLPDHLKLRIMVCQSKEKPLAGLVGSALGDVGIELIAATGNDGLEFRGSYLLRRYMIEYLKASGCSYYNLNGINPKKNPGGYQFKSGLCGKSGLDVNYVGMFEACTNPNSYIVAKIGEMVRTLDTRRFAKIFRQIKH